MSTGYWEKTLKQRLIRRRVMALGAGSVAAAAFLAACGGGDDDGGAFKDPSGLLTQPANTAKNAVGGGIFQSYLTADVDHFDPMDAQRGVLTNSLNVYSQVIKYKLGTPDSLPDGSFSGDAAQSWEVSPDGLTVTFKLRPNVKLDQRPPTNGRALDSQDWLYSWNTFVAKAPASAELSAKRNPDSPVDSWSAPDKSTIVVKMAYPYAPILAMVADSRYSFVLVGIEHDGKYDAHIESRGSGPFMLDSWVRSARVVYKKNPNYWDAPRPYLDGVEQPILSEYAQRLAQLRAGNIWTADVRQEDVIPVKKDVPKLDLWLNPKMPLTAPGPIAFSLKPNSPFHDIRVRKGISMLLDREALMDLNYNTSGLKKEGLDIPARLHTIVSAGDDRFWTDWKDLGEGAKFHQFNPTEAAALLRAAGIANLDLPFNVRMTTAGAVVVTPVVQAVAGMLEGQFFKPHIEVLNPAESNTNIHRGHGLLYDGIAAYGGGSAADPDLTLTRYYSTSEFRMFPGKLPYDDLFQTQRRELDVKKRQDTWKEIQKRWAAEVTDVIAPIPGLAQQLILSWPFFQNYNGQIPWTSLTAFPVEAMAQYWYDKTKV